jgi:hypothetical protein
MLTSQEHELLDKQSSEYGFRRQKRAPSVFCHGLMDMSRSTMGTKVLAADDLLPRYPGSRHKISLEQSLFSHPYLLQQNACEADTHVLLWQLSNKILELAKSVVFFRNSKYSKHIMHHLTFCHLIRDAKSIVNAE